MDFEQIEKLIAKLETSKLKKLVIKEGDFELHLEKEEEVYPRLTTAHPRIMEEPVYTHEPSPKGERARKGELEGKFVVSPMVGTYYASPSPETPAFVKVGDRVDEHTIVCIIEAMKVMNEVKAGTAGVISEIFMGNAHPVEFGTKLFRIT